MWIGLKPTRLIIALSKSMQAKAKSHLHDIWQAKTKAEDNVTRERSCDHIINALP